MSNAMTDWPTMTIPELVGADGVFSDGDWVESKDQDPHGEVRLIQLADIGEGRFRDRSSRSLTAGKAAELNCTYLEPGDVLIARMPDPLGRACMFPDIGQPAVTAVDVAIVRPRNERVDRRWLMHFINAPQFRAQVAALQRGTTRKRISRKNLATIALPVPPHDQQRRIAQAIEEHLSRLDAGVESLHRAQRNLTRVRAAVLKAAFEGLPTAPLSARLREPLRNGKSAKRSTDGRVRVLTLSAVTDRDFSDYNTKMVDLDPDDLDDLWILPGDVFVERSNTPELVGSAALYRGGPRWAIFPDLLIRVRASDELDPRFLELCLQSPPLRQYFRSKAKGIAGSMPKIDQGVVAAAPIPDCPRDRQSEVVASIERHLSIIDSNEGTAERALKRSFALRRSILGAAFEGRLTQGTR